MYGSPSLLMRAKRSLPREVQFEVGCCLLPSTTAEIPIPLKAPMISVTVGSETQRLQGENFVKKKKLFTYFKFFFFFFYYLFGSLLPLESFELLSR